MPASRAATCTACGVRVGSKAVPGASGASGEDGAGEDGAGEDGTGGIGEDGEEKDTARQPTR